MERYICFVFLLLFWGCANIIPPVGGEKDVYPPVLLSAIPLNESLGFDTESISLIFDEYIQLNNKDAIKISPICEPPPEIIVRGKKIQIQLFCSLDSTVTYTINFGKSITDLNEGNILENFTYVFTAGSELDSLNVNGVVKELYPNQPISNAVVGVYKNSDLLNPYYYTFSNASGEFVIENIKDDEYLLFSFFDNNQNFKYDFGELACVPEKLNDFNEKKNLGLFYEKDSLAQINAMNINKNTVRFEHPISSDSIIILNSAGFWNRDSLFSEFWFKNNPRFINYKFGEKVDSIEIYNTDTAKFSLQSINNLEEIVLNKEVIIKSKIPIKTINPDKFRWDDSGALIRPNLMNAFTVQVPINASVGTMKKLIIDSGAIITENLLKNDSLTFIFNIDPSQYGSINLMSSQLNKNMIVELFNEKGVVKKCALIDSTKIEYIKPGNYYLRVFHDKDNDYHWTSGNITKQQAGELVYIYPEAIKIKPNWNLELLINPENTY